MVVHLKTLLICIHLFVRTNKCIQIAKVSKDAIKRFNESTDGKRLYNIMEQHRQAYVQSKDLYNREREKFVDTELKHIENAINTLP